MTLGKTTTLIITVIVMSFLMNCKGDSKKQKSKIIANNESQNSYQNVDAPAFKKMADSGEVIILDVRTPSEVTQGHIEGSSAVNVLDKDFVRKINLMNKEKTICVYCRSGSRSAKASQLLIQNGFAKVYNLIGGIKAWENAKYPLKKGLRKKDENIKTLKLDKFHEILKTDKTVLVNFQTEWCAPCRNMAPIVDEIEKQTKDKVVVIRVDIDKSKEIAKRYNITGVPVFMVYKNGKVTWKHNGIIAKKELLSKIAQ